MTVENNVIQLREDLILQTLRETSHVSRVGSHVTGRHFARSAETNHLWNYQKDSRYS